MYVSQSTSQSVSFNRSTDCVNVVCCSLLRYRVNDGLVALADSHTEDADRGKHYLVVLVSFSVVLYAGSLCAIGTMFHYFTGCPANDLVLSLTLILPIVSAPSPPYLCFLFLCVACCFFVFALFQCFVYCMIFCCLLGCF